MVPRKTIQKSFKRGFQKERDFRPAPVIVVLIVREHVAIAEGIVRHERPLHGKIEVKLAHHLAQIVARKKVSANPPPCRTFPYP